MPYFEVSPNPLGVIKKEFEDIEAVSSGNWNKIRDDIKVEFHICDESSPKMQKLAEILNDKQTFIVYSNYASRCSDIKNLCNQIGVEGVLLASNLMYEDRVWDFITRPDHHVIISNDSESKGFDFQVDHGVLYNLPNSISSLVSKLGTIKTSGTVSVLLEKEENKFKECFRPGESLASLLQFYSQSKNRKFRSLIPE